jgi:hypothetical protein
VGIRFPIICRVVGFIGMVHAILGLAIGLKAMWSFDPSALDDRDVARATLSAAPDTQKETPRINAALAEIIPSARFRLCFYSFATFGLLFNVLLALACCRLLQARAGGLGILLSLTIAYALYSYALPKLIRGTPESPEWFAFAGAWGIGNSGLIMMGTYFWLWGPALALVGRGIRLSPTKPLRVPAP